jgi:SAM-dependent methyltransferase
MKAEDYYRKIEEKWKYDYPSSKNIDEIWDFYIECGYENPQETIGGILDKVKWNKKRVLDFGCDKGFMLDFICNRYPSLSGYGIDINSAAIKTAREFFPGQEFEAFDGMTIPYGEKYFDLVFVCAVMKHVRYEDRDHIYSELNRVADKVFIIEADEKTREKVSYKTWTFYNSNFEEEFEQHFHPIKVMHEAGDLLGLYSCR